MSLSGTRYFGNACAGALDASTNRLISPMIRYHIPK